MKKQIITREQANLWRTNYMNNQKSKGLCVFCREEKLPDSSLCEKHYFSAVARGNLKNIKMAGDIKDLFYAQDGKCYLTGKSLVLGVNASLDHLEPRSKRDDLVNNIHNLRWCDKDVNRIKRDLSYEDFIKMCKEVLNIHKKINEKRN